MIKTFKTLYYQLILNKFYIKLCLLVRKNNGYIIRQNTYSILKKKNFFEQYYLNKPKIFQNLVLQANIKQILYKIILIYLKK